ncbi:MobC family plasmid mobilization relaxosome protein [Escherichia coli]|uniref:MobC family plasmid mobilization relaxosome protein n=2 Tax=Escherichia coli TaxID=562 RepID=UPI001C610B9B|nr:MobC family plasmid mobilization relaxosome protein [Escherichia coli]MBW5329135.1 MobC family plasmid mobilization relaxosome protein [Escherichia coli]
MLRKREGTLRVGVREDEQAGYGRGGGEKKRGVGRGGVWGGGRVAGAGGPRTRAPPLLRQLAAIGNNLNQTARKVNSGQWSSGDRVQVVAALMAIGDELRRLRLAVREQGARDDS